MITPDMILLDIVEKYPETIPVFKKYDEEVSACICCTSLFETLEQAISKHDLELSRVLSDLNSIITK